MLPRAPSPAPSPGVLDEPASEPATAKELVALLARRRDAFLSFVRRRVRSGADAEDLLQQALLKALERVGSLRAGDRLDAWFYRVLRNTIADHHADWARREAREERLELQVDGAAAPPPEAAVCGCSLGVLETIRPEYAAILRRVDLDGDKLEDTARALHIAPNNAKVRLHRARKSMRSALLSFCGTDSARACLTCDCEAGPSAARPGTARA